MKYLQVVNDAGIATVTLQRDKVNPLNEEVVDQLQNSFEELVNDAGVKAVILTGRGKFFSFGFDIPGFMNHSKEDFTNYLTKFTRFYNYLFMYPKPVIAALNGHTIAGGCMIATACDYRIMVEGNAKISLNEITFGSTVFAGSVEMLKFVVGAQKAEKILYTGKLYSAEEALKLNLIDEVVVEEYLVEYAGTVAEDFTKKDQAAFNSIKKLLRTPVYEEILKREKDSIDDFIGIWYSEKTRDQLKKINIHS